MTRPAWHERGEVHGSRAEACSRRTSRWIARVQTPEGRERAKTFDRKVDAEAWVTAQESAKQRGEWVDPRLGRLTFREWSARWETTVVDLRGSTLDLYRSQLRNHLLPRFGDAQLGRITPSGFRAFVADLIASGAHSPSTVGSIVRQLSTMLTAAIDEGLIVRNPCQGVKLPQPSQTEMVFLTAEQLDELADAIDPWHRVLLVTAGYLGLRWGEVAGLRPDRVDLLRRRVHVVEQLTEVSGHHGFGRPKTAAGRRSVSVPTFLLALFEEQLGERSTDRLVFPSKDGAPMRRSNFRRRAWVPACVAAGLGEMVENNDSGRRRYSGLRFHDLRHTAVALAIEQGAHPKAIQARMGHSSITVTLDRYGHLFPIWTRPLRRASMPAGTKLGRDCEIPVPVRRSGSGT